MLVRDTSVNAVSAVMPDISSTVANIRDEKNACLNKAAEKETSSHCICDV